MHTIRLMRVVLILLGCGAFNTAISASEYELDSVKSSLYLVSTKQIHVVESHTFERLSGSIDNNGNAVLDIDLSSIESGIALRNQRMRDMLFEITRFANATASVSIDPSMLSQIGNGEQEIQRISAILNLHGVSSVLETQVRITRMSDSELLVQNVTPILISASDYNLADGIDALKNIANLNVISYTVPVNFSLFFAAKIGGTE